MDYGCLPFELLRVLASIALGMFFGFVMWQNRRTVPPVHYMIFGVVLLGTCEALSWLIAYKYMNKTGDETPLVTSLLLCLDVPVWNFSARVYGALVLIIIGCLHDSFDI